MKWVANKTFPHPVLSERGPASGRDYIDQKFQMTSELTRSEDRSVHLELSFTLSEQSLLRLIHQNKARYAVEVHCRKTYVRRLLSSAKSKFSETFPKGELHDLVEISPYIVCIDYVKGHSSKTLHPEFGKNAAYGFVPGDVLAIAHPTSHPVNSDFAKTIGSVFVLQPSANMQKGEFDITWDEEKIHILVHRKDAHRLATLQNNRQMLPFLLASVPLITVAETLRIMAMEPDAHTGKKWFKVIQYKLNEKEIELNDSSSFHRIAQQLLAFPVGKMLDMREE